MTGYFIVFVEFISKFKLKAIYAGSLRWELLRSQTLWHLDHGKDLELLTSFPLVALACQSAEIAKNKFIVIIKRKIILTPLNLKMNKESTEIKRVCLHHLVVVLLFRKQI